MNGNKPPSTSAPAVRMTCSVCGRVFLLDETNSPPFCSERCKMIDLNRWFGEEIGLPHEGGPSKGEAIDPDTAEPDRLS